MYEHVVFQDGPRRKKRKSEVEQVEEKADLLAMGTAAGTVLIYSTVKGALHCTLVSLTVICCCDVFYTISKKNSTESTLYLLK